MSRTTLMRAYVACASAETGEVLVSLDGDSEYVIDRETARWLMVQIEDALAFPREVDANWQEPDK